MGKTNKQTNSAFYIGDQQQSQRKPCKPIVLRGILNIEVESIYLLSLEREGKGRPNDVLRGYALAAQST